MHSFANIRKGGGKNLPSKEEHGDAILLSQVEVIKSRKPINKMINIHVGDAAFGPRWDDLTVLSNIHMYYNGSSEQCSSACCSCSVQGGGDQEVNMMQSSSFISPMTVRTMQRETGAARCTKSLYKISV